MMLFRAYNLTRCWCKYVIRTYTYFRWQKAFFFTIMGNKAFAFLRAEVMELMKMSKDLGGEFRPGSAMRFPKQPGLKNLTSLL